LDGRRGDAFCFGAVGAALCACLFLSADEEFFLSLLVPELLRCLEDLGSEGRRRVHYALPLHLEDVPRQVRLLQLMGIFVYEDDAVFGGVEGLAEVVGDESADGTESEDMEAHWPVLRVSRVACLKRCLHAPRLEYGKVRKAWSDDSYQSTRESVDATRNGYGSRDIA